MNRPETLSLNYGQESQQIYVRVFPDKIKISYLHLTNGVVRGSGQNVLFNIEGLKKELNQQIQQFYDYCATILEDK